jgi:ubiquinone biosynthesis protein
MLPIHPGRYLQIITTLSRHGLGWLVARLGLATVVPFHWGLLGHPRRRKPYSAPEHLRLAFEDLGPTFIKLAQILSTRPDLISPPYAEELSRLQDRVRPYPLPGVHRYLRRRGCPLLAALLAPVDKNSGRS